jgi:hypothetical protein
MEPDRVTAISAKLSLMKSLRSPFEKDWNDIRDYVRPITLSFNQLTGQFQNLYPETMYDGTAPQALEDLSGALMSYLTNPAERWFEIQVHGMQTKDPQILEWLDIVTEIIYAQYQDQDVNLNPTLHEAYLDIAGFGTACISQEWNADKGSLLFSAKPLALCFFSENNQGYVDTLYRVMHWTLRQVKQEFGGVLPKKLMEIKDQEKLIEVVHAVYPRTDRISGLLTKTNKAFASVWISNTTMEVLEESGYDSFPYHVGRWTKLAGEIYGRGPARKCLPDIKMLNAMEKTLLKAGQKQVDPPLVLRNEGFMLPIRTSPGSIIFKEEEDAAITPLEIRGNLPWGEDKAQQKREFINKCFYADFIRMEKENVQMTAYEVQDRRDEKLRMLAPMLGRMVAELLSPMISRSYQLLATHNKIPPAPPAIVGKRLSVGYVSPAARAQIGAKALLISRYLQDLLPFAQATPDILDAIDMDSVAQELAICRGVPRAVLRTKEDIDGIRAGKQRAAQMQQMTAVAEPASKAIKNLADAGALGGMQ